MRRRAGVVHPARRRLPSFLLDLGTKPFAKWPPHLRLAFEILKDDLGLSEQTARTVITDSISAAHECAQAINQRSGQIFESETRTELHDSLRRIANCIKRSPVRLQKRLDESIGGLLKEGVIDLEVVEGIFGTTASVFAEFPDVEPSRTALRQMCGMSPDHANVVTIKSDYASIGAIHQRGAEDAIAELARASIGQVRASDVFKALAGALGSEQDINSSSQIYDLIVHYAVEVAKVWRQVGLRPSRARHPEDPTYKSKFHRFVDLVLAAMIEPEARRHLVDLDDMRRKVRMAHNALPHEFRRITSPTLRRADIVWLVSDDHLKKALRIRDRACTRKSPDLIRQSRYSEADAAIAALVETRSKTVAEYQHGLCQSPAKRWRVSRRTSSRRSNALVCRH